MKFAIKRALLLLSLLLTTQGQDYDGLITSIFNAQNSFRTDPNTHATNIENERVTKILNDGGTLFKCYDSGFDSGLYDGVGTDVRSDCSSTVITVNEGNDDPWTSAVTDLGPGGKYGEPIHPLLYSKGLENSCADLVMEQGTCSFRSGTGNNYIETGHTGIDGSSAWDRARRYINYRAAAENIAYGQYTDSTFGEFVIQ